MQSFLNLLLYMALAATAITLVIGFAAMFRTGQKDRTAQSNRLMRMRIMFQAGALIILALLLLMSKGGQ